MELLDVVPLQRHRLSVEAYHRMAETGVLPRNARVELIEGEVLDMATVGTRHYAMVSRLTRLIVQAVGNRAVVAPQLPIVLDNFSEPETDLAVLLPRDDFYASKLPTGRDALLVIEVADSSIDYDLRVKAPLYARHGVPEYWVVDLNARALRFFRACDGERYTDITATETPRRLALPGVEIDLGGALL